MRGGLLYFILLFIAANSFAQPAIYPDQWILLPEKSDEFNKPFLDSTKWWKLNACAYTDGIRHGYIGGQGAIWKEHNVFMRDGNVVFKVEYNTDSAVYDRPCPRFNKYPFYSGGIVSIMTNGGKGIGERGDYTYGYYEMRAKLPGYYDADHNPVGFGFYPTFWIFYQYHINRCIYIHDEVDILEPAPEQYYDARTNVFGWHDEADSCSAHKIGEDSVRSVTPYFEEYHKFGLELFPDHIVFYLDDQKIYSADTISDPSIAHSLNMLPYLAVEMNLQMGGNPGRPYPRPDAVFPNYMYVDYFRYYHPRVSTELVNKLWQNYPNPAASDMTIKYQINEGSENAFINISNLVGQQMKSIRLNEKGISEIVIDDNDLRPGVYFYSLVVDKRVVETKKMIVM